MARLSRGSPVGLLALVFAAASGVTAILSLDATVVLLTPVVFATAARLRLRPRPHVYACAHLANSASLLLPVSNLTNLLALRASGLSFAAFAALMAVPWVAVIGVEWLVFRRFFATDLVGRGEAVPAAAPTGAAPVFALVVLGLTLVAFVAASLVHLDPAFAAAADRLGRPARQVARRGRVERVVVSEVSDAVDLLVAARDGDRAHPGPRSLGPATRFVVDHAPCAVLLVWPDDWGGATGR